MDGGGVPVPCATAASGVARTIAKANKVLLQRNMTYLHPTSTTSEPLLEIGHLIKIKGRTLNRTGDPSRVRRHFERFVNSQQPLRADLPLPLI